MVVDITQRCDAVVSVRILETGLLEAVANEIADRLRPVGVSVLCNEVIDLGDKISSIVIVIAPWVFPLIGPVIATPV